MIKSEPPGEHREEHPYVYRSVFVSDIHLGSAGCKVHEVDRFLRNVECDRLYLVGDIFDGWVASRDRKWKQAHANVIRTILGKSKGGTSVFYTPGNHDSFMRRMNGGELGNTLIDHSFEHWAPDGSRYVVVHGDLFDKTITRLHPLAYVAAWGYEFVTVLNVRVNSTLLRRHRKAIDFSTATKKLVKRLVKKKNNFEEDLIGYAREVGYSGAICGHVHRPEVTTYEDGFVYANCGDWVEHGTALVEHFDGRLELVWWKDIEPTLPEEEAPSNAQLTPIRLK